MTRALLFGRDSGSHEALLGGRDGTLSHSRMLVAGVLAAAIGASLAYAQTMPATPSMSPATATAPTPLTLTPAPLTPAGPVVTPATLRSTPAAESTQAFVGVIKGDRVYVRSGPGVNYYELGQLGKGDTVQVVGQRSGWYLIEPPAGSFCYIAKDLVDADPDGKEGTVKGEYVNVRAASALHPAAEYAILAVVRKGTKLAILGSTDKYYKITPPDRAYMFVATQFVAAAPAGTGYTTPGLRVAGTVAPPAATRPATDLTMENIVIHPPAATEEAAATQTATTEAAPVGPQQVVVTPLPPTTTYAPDAMDRYTALNAKLQAEFQKPVADRELAGLLEDFQALLTTPNVSPSIRQNTQARIAIIQKTMAFQALAKAQKADAASFVDQDSALQQQYGAIEEQLKAAEAASPPLAEGRLQTSSVESRYVLVNPATGRVTAYLDPKSDVDLTKLLGSYVAVRGAVESAQGLAVKTIKVHTATLLPDPAKAGGADAGR